MMKYLIKNDGSEFSRSELNFISAKLSALNNEDRARFRDSNASEIAKYAATNFLIVSGPGTGKSYLFLARMNHWCDQDESAKIFVTSFVRKLVVDLQNDINSDARLKEKNITVSTLHKFARSIVEKNHGTKEWSFLPHFRIIGQSWKDIVWRDVLAFGSGLDETIYSRKDFDDQLHNNCFNSSPEWQHLKDAYYGMCQFFNAAGFPDLILRAKDALVENEKLHDYGYFIIDEYQDFNLAEEALINQMAQKPKGILVVGDDEQVLYEELKSGKPTLIRNLYRANQNYANGMLPFCGRSSFHITTTAGHFIQENIDPECIEKIYLPIRISDGSMKVQVIACPASSTAVDYICKFVEDNKSDIENRRKELSDNMQKDPFLLILTPTKTVNFYSKSKDEIFRIVSELRPEVNTFTEDYLKVLNYYSLANYPQNNFNFRKVLYHENISQDTVHILINDALKADINLCDVKHEIIEAILNKCRDIKKIIEDDSLPVDTKILKISNLVSISDTNQLTKDVASKPISEKKVAEIEYEDDENSELGEIKKMGAVELLTIVGSKGLSADHVIIIGFDDVNMRYVTKNAFYVAMTRARKSLHIVTALKSGGSRYAHKFIDCLPDENIEYYSYQKKNHQKRLLRGKAAFRSYLSYFNAMVQGVLRK